MHCIDESDRGGNMARPIEVELRPGWLADDVRCPGTCNAVTNTAARVRPVFVAPGRSFAPPWRAFPKGTDIVGFRVLVEGVGFEPT